MAVVTFREWTEEEDAILAQRVSEGATNPQIAAELGRTHRSIENRMARRGLQRYRRQPAGVTLTREVAQRGAVTILAPISTSQEPDDAFLQRAIDRTSQSVLEHKHERYVRLEIVSGVDVGISCSSDWHVSTTGPCDVEGLVEYAETVRDTPNLYALGVGDMSDNPIKWDPKGVKEVPDDLRLMDIVLGKFGGKMLGLTSGNHDDWTRTMVGIDSLKSMAERHQLHYAPDELVWLIDIKSPEDGELTATWVLATRHKYYRHSNLNHTHACWRWLEDGANNWPHDGKGATLLPDALAIGHNHVAAVEQRTYQRGLVTAMRMGAWQHTSRFTRAGGWTLMPPTAPTLVLPAVRDGVNQPKAFAHYQHAVEALT